MHPYERFGTPVADSVAMGMYIEDDESDEEMDAHSPNVHMAEWRIIQP